MRLIGRTPKVTSDLAEELANLTLISAEAAGDGEFGKSAELRRVAWQAFIEAEAKHQLRVAHATRGRTFQVFNTGVLVLAWRIEKWKLRFKPTWTGPAIVIAHEPSSSEVHQNASSGTKEPPRPGSAVWVVMGGRVIKAAPEHLRMASTLEMPNTTSRTLQNPLPTTCKRS